MSVCELFRGVLVGKGVRWHTLVIALQRVSTGYTPTRSVSMGPPACLPGGPDLGEHNG